MMNRRRFLTISAATLAAPAWAGTHRWQGRAFGAEISLTIRGPAQLAAQAMAEARSVVAEVEALFSLYDAASMLSQFNATGRLDNPAPRFLALMQRADEAYHLTDGLFDPTVQPLWRAYALGIGVDRAADLVGWDRVRFGPAWVRLGAGQALTFNGIAQGFATDLVTARFADLRLVDVLVNMGEHRALGGPWRLEVADPKYGALGMRTLHNGAMATSSPGAMILGTGAHILHPERQPQWSTVSVEAETATMADYLSTSLSLAPFDQVASMLAHPQVKRITLVDFNGDLQSLS